jgi:hypothetical protein
MTVTPKHPAYRCANGHDFWGSGNEKPDTLPCPVPDCKTIGKRVDP